MFDTWELKKYIIINYQYIDVTTHDISKKYLLFNTCYRKKYDYFIILTKNNLNFD